MKKPFVISISGISGSGTTTIASALKKHLVNSSVIYFDDYGDEVYIDRDINDWSEDSNDCNEWHTEQIAADIERLLKEPNDYIVLDYPFGYLNDCVGKYINLTVFVDTPLDVALARRIIRDYTSRGAESDFGLADVEELSLAGLDKELRFYLSRSRLTYVKMPEMQKQKLDLAVDGTKMTEEITDEIISHITTRNHYDCIIDEIDNPLEYKVVDPAHDTGPLKAYMDKWDGELFIEAMQLTPNKSVLEIGVGTGRLALRVCDKCESFTGIDISPKTVERAKDNLRKFQNIYLICNDFLSYSFDKSFDVIYSSLTFMHIKDKLYAIKKVTNLLNPGGRFILSIDKNQQTEIDYGNRKIKAYPDAPDESFSLLTKSGLDIENQFETEFAVVFSAVKGMQ